MMRNTVAILLLGLYVAILVLSMLIVGLGGSAIGLIVLWLFAFVVTIIEYRAEKKESDRS
jgi:putative effector of murein hydrolase LrgA (UPF0299 family)